MKEALDPRIKKIMQEGGLQTEGGIFDPIKNIELHGNFFRAFKKKHTGIKANLSKNIFLLVMISSGIFDLIFLFKYFDFSSTTNIFLEIIFLFQGLFFLVIGLKMAKDSFF